MHYLVYNRTAGRGRMPDALGQAVGFFERSKLPLEVLPPVQGEELTALLRTLPDDAVILSLGGDGTLNGVLEATCNTRRTVGILPAGSADDFASALGFPRDTLAPALEAVVAGRTRLVDTGEVQLVQPDGSRRSARFVNALGTGFDAEVARQRELRFNWLRGEAGYYTALALGWLRMRREHLTLEAGEQTVFSGRSLLVSCQNGPRTGGSFHFAPGTVVDDGQFDLLMAGNLGRFRLLRLLPRVLGGKSLDDPFVMRVPGTDFTVTWQRPRTVHMDGEIHPETVQVIVQLVPGSLRVIVP